MGRLVGNLGFVLLICLRNVNALLAKKKKKKKKNVNACLEIMWNSNFDSFI